MLDTGATASVLHGKFVDISQLNPGPFQVLEMWNGASVQSRGTLNYRLLTLLDMYDTKSSSTWYLETTNRFLD